MSLLDVYKTGQHACMITEVDTLTDIDLCANQERDKGKERNPKLWAQAYTNVSSPSSTAEWRSLQSLSDDERSRVCDHADFECAHEAHLRRHQDNES